MKIRFEGYSDDLVYAYQWVPDGEAACKFVVKEFNGHKEPAVITLMDGDGKPAAQVGLRVEEDGWMPVLKSLRTDTNLLPAGMTVEFPDVLDRLFFAMVVTAQGVTSSMEEL